MKTLPSAVTSQMESQQKRPALLFDLGISGSTLYYVAEKNDITFNGNLYSAKAITVSEFTQSAEGQINRITINLDNTERDMAAYATYATFEGRPIVIKRVYKDVISGTTHYNEVFRGTMEEISDIGRTWLPITATIGKPLYQKALLNEYVRTCRHNFGDSFCNLDGFSNLASVSNYAEGQILSGSTNYMIIDTTTGSVTGTNNDVFNYGIIKVGKSGTTYIRTCYDWTSATSRADWQVGLPVSLDSNYRYQIYKGCPKDLNACTAAFVWGPIADNRINFGGFLHIGKEKFSSIGISGGAETPQYSSQPAPSLDYYGIDQSANNQTDMSGAYSQAYDQGFGAGSRKTFDGPDSYGIDWNAALSQGEDDGMPDGLDSYGIDWNAINQGGSIGGEAGEGMGDGGGERSDWSGNDSRESDPLSGGPMGDDVT